MSLKKKILFLTITVSIIFVVCFGAIFAKWYTFNVLYPIKYQEIVIENSNKYGIDKYIVFAVINVESSFKENAKSNKGANGLMQLTKSTADYVSKLYSIPYEDIFEPKSNISLGCAYINYLSNIFKNIETALIAYNAGEGNVKSWLKNHPNPNNTIEIEKIPFLETREYIKKVRKSFEKYKKLYGYILDK